MFQSIHVVDLFSGPGGLSEGFASLRDKSGLRPYSIGISIEKDPAAHRTLRLRAFLRQFDEFPREYYDWLNDGGAQPDWKSLYPDQWEVASAEAICAELGTDDTAERLSKAIFSINRESLGRTVLIGGPPCQAYSLVGRARNAGIRGYVPADDHRHFLYKEYCRVLAELAPAVFVMENVKGMLSSNVAGRAIFQQVLDDLAGAGPGYKLFSLSRGTDTSPSPRDFLVEAEAYGVPQSRHRVIIVGVRADVASRLPSASRPHLTPVGSFVSVSQVLGGMPSLRSGLSRNDSPDHWMEAMGDAIACVRQALNDYPGSHLQAFKDALESAEAELPAAARLGRSSHKRTVLSDAIPRSLSAFLDDEKLDALVGHETRGHMHGDLARYLYAACFAVAEGVSPKAHEFPSSIAPKHANWTSGKFADRFRVQVRDRPSTTVTSHISKDGHYFIHPDPKQCRSLTVREAARLQSFPDNYVFLGNRTEQYVQVGNAVPPYLAIQIAEAILPIFEMI